MEPKPKYLNGLRVEHRVHHRLGTILSPKWRADHHTMYYVVDVDADPLRGKPRMPQTVWAESNLIILEVPNNLSAKSLLDKEW